MSSGLIPIKFPATRQVLWDRTPRGNPIVLHICQASKPLLVLDEQPLRLAQRLAQNNAVDDYKCSFIGSLTSNPDDDGVQIHIERMDQSVALNYETSNGDINVPCSIKRNSVKPPTTSNQYYECIAKSLHARCHSKDNLDLGQFLHPVINCSYHSYSNHHLLYIDFDLVVPGLTFKAVPINPIPVLPTALSKNLSSPMNLSGTQCRPKTGYLSMDQTRKLLLILESDPKGMKLPLVGIWVSGVASICNPYVWASCLRYIKNKNIEDRVCGPPDEFIILLYSTLHSKPELYECNTNNGERDLDFNIYRTHEIIHLNKTPVGRPNSPVESKLQQITDGQVHECFTAAVQKAMSQIASIEKDSTATDANILSDDVMPRNSPAPLFSKVDTVLPSVPEVSLLLDENYQMMTSLPAAVNLTSNVPQCSAVQKKEKKKRVPKKNVDERRGPLKPVNRDPKSMSPVSVCQASINSLAYHPAYYAPVQGYPQVPVYNQHSPYAHWLPPPMYNLPHLAQLHHSSQYRSDQSNDGHTIIDHTKYTVHHDNISQELKPKVSSSSHTKPRMSHKVQPSVASLESNVIGSGSPHIPFELSSQTNLHIGNSSPRAKQNNAEESKMVAASSKQGSPESYDIQDVYRILREKDGELQDLKQQIQILLARQEQSTSESHAKTQVSAGIEHTNIGTQSSLQNTPVKKVAKNTCEMAINTSMLWPDSGTLRNMFSPSINEIKQSSAEETPCRKRDDVAIKTTPFTDMNPDEYSQKLTPGSAQFLRTNLDPQPQTSSPLSSKEVDSHQQDTNSQSVACGPHQSPPSKGSSSGTTPFSSDTLTSLGDFNLTQIQNNSSDSIESQLVVDMPEYGSPSPDRSLRSGVGNGLPKAERSPVLGESVSMYQQHREESGDDSADTGLGESHPEASLLYNNQKQFYENLIGNVKKFLVNHGQQSDSPTLSDNEKFMEDDPTAKVQPKGIELNGPPSLGSTPRHQFQTPNTELDADLEDEEVDVVEETRKQLLKMGIDIDSLTPADSTLLNMRNNQSMFFDASMLPHINYVSIMLESDNDSSADLDAMAMKYLSDNQLAELAKLHQTATPKSKSTPLRNAAISRLMAGTNSSSNVTLCGMHGNNLSLSTRKYMENYGLIEVKGKKNESPLSTRQSDKHVDNSSINVKEFMQKLSESSFVDNGKRACGFRDDGDSYRSSHSDPARGYFHRDKYQTSGGAEGKPSRYPAQELPREGTCSPRPADRASSDHTPMRVFDSEFKNRMRQRELERTPSKLPHHGFQEIEKNDSPVRQVLDIARLKELPKLL